MPELPPPPPPPLSLAGVIVDASRRGLARIARSRMSPADPDGTASTITGPVLSPSVAIGVALVVMLVLVAGGGWLLLQRLGGGRSTPPEVTLPRAAPRPASAATDVDAGPDANPADPDTAAGVGADGDRPPGPVTVHAAGAVVRPGLYRLPPGARVADLVDAAGGAASDAEIDALNLAAPLGDGERVYVPRRGELAPGSLVAGGTTGGDGPDPPERPVDLNTATLEQLDALPGVGPSTAQAIIDYRRRQGRFRSVDELLEVRGIGPSRLQALRKKVRV